MPSRLARLPPCAVVNSEVRMEQRDGLSTLLLAPIYRASLWLAWAAANIWEKAQ
jgi:hypothetical protein